MPEPSFGLNPIEQLGKALYSDPSLSTPLGQSCASCHADNTRGTEPDDAVNAAGAVEPGVIHTRSGNRKPPTVAYAGFTPILHQCMGGGGMDGGGMGDGGMGGSGMGSGGMGSSGMGGSCMGGGDMMAGTSRHG